MNIKNNKKLYLYFGTGIAVMIVIIVIILIISLMSGGKLSFEALENKINKIALNYVLDRTDMLPVKGEENTISYQELVDAKKIKPLNEMLKDKTATCEVSIKIKNNNEHYMAITTLDCGEKYQSKSLKNKILEDNVIVNSSYGLYKINNEYIFRGEKVNNYVSFNNKLWRIIKITANGDIRLIEVTRNEKYVWDDRYNSERNSKTGINDYRVSRIRDTLTDIYNNEFDDNMKSYITSQNVCLGKRDSESTNNSGSIECSDILSNQYISLLQAYEFTVASIDSKCISLTDSECTNYNYMANFDKTFWTITADTYKTDKAYKISSSIMSATTSGASAIKVVIHLDGDVLFTEGNGTEENPYKIKTAN